MTNIEVRKILSITASGKIVARPVLHRKKVHAQIGARVAPAVHVEPANGHRVLRVAHAD